MVLDNKRKFPGRMDGRTALVTGAGRRVGRAIALELAASGARVAVHFYQSKREAEETSRLAGNSSRSFQADLCSVKEAEYLAEEVRREFGRIDLLVNSAARFGRTKFGETTENEWDRFHDLNLKSIFFLSQAVANRMNEGSIIHIADTCALDPWPGYLAYSLSKTGLSGLTRGMARALAPRIRVNAVLPGPVLRPDNEDESVFLRAVDKTLLKRAGDPSDIASAVRFLAAEGTWITGVLLPVDGGRHSV